jgi:hypothetical protein
VRQLQRALLCRIAVSPGISASSLLERFGAYGACHVREQLQQLQGAGLLRCTALTVRTPPPLTTPRSPVQPRTPRRLPYTP